MSDDDILDLSETFWEKLWRLTESNFFWGGGVGMVLVAYGFVLGGALKLSIALLVIGWLVITVSIYRHRFFEGKSKRIQVAGQSFISASLAIVIAVLWLALRPVTSPDPSLPLVVEVIVDQKKQLRIVNNGKIPIKNVELSDTGYIFNRQAWEQKRLEIGQVQKSGAPFLNIPEIKAESSSDPFDLTKSGFFDIEDWDTVVARQPENTDSLDDAFLKYYCLRATFRDSRSGMKYVIYKVIGSIIDAPSVVDNLDRTSVGGPPRHIFIQDIPEVLIRNQRELYKGDDAKEYQSPSPPPSPTPEPPKTLHDLFIADFPNILKGRVGFPITAKDGTAVAVEAQLYADFEGRSMFVGFYVPSGPHTYQACAYLADHTDIPLALVKNIPKGGRVGEVTPSTDLTFTRRVYIYHQDELSNVELGSLSKLYESKNLAVEFRSTQYWLLREATTH